MKTPFRQFLLSSVLVVSLGVTAILAPAVSHAHVEKGNVATPPTPADAGAVADAPSLHNPNFDNGLWYEFNQRHAPTYPVDVWVPDGNWYEPPDRWEEYGDIQDWRLWFKNGTALIDSGDNNNYVHSAPKSVKMWPWDVPSSTHHVAGIYQLIENTTPCLTYGFQIYGLSRQEEVDDELVRLKVGIETTGWTLDPDHAPAVHDGDWPTTMVWGASQKYEGEFGLLEVTAEALDTQITVFTYADALGGNSHKIHWDTGSLQESVPSELVSNPDDPGGSPSGIDFGPVVSTDPDSALVTWHSVEPAISQVYYRLIAGPSNPVSPPGTLLPFAIYLPFLGRGPDPWFSTPLDSSYEDSHSVVISGLQPESTYEYFVASRGVSGNACVTWVSAKDEFTTLTTQ
jgi:hypothetical protein